MSRSTFSVLFYANKSKVKNGIVPVMGRITIVTAEMVRNAYQGFGSEYETLLGAFDKDIANLKRRVGKDRALGTYKLQVRSRNYVADFLQMNSVAPIYPCRNSHPTSSRSLPSISAMTAIWQVPPFG